MVTKEEVGNRIRIARKELGWSQKALSEKSEIPLPSLKDYEGGKRMPGGEAIASFCAVGINPAWLLTNDGQMLINNAQADEHEAKALGDEYALLPLYDVRAAAGHGAVIEHEQVIDWLAFKKEWLHRELHANASDLYLIEVDGESMEPTLRPGDIILVDRRDASTLPRDGVYVIRMDSTLLVKRLQRLPGGQVRVSSDNQAYEPFVIELDKMDDQTSIIGRVVWSGRRM